MFWSLTCEERRGLVISVSESGWMERLGPGAGLCP